jgi:hypothetical protein
MVKYRATMMDILKQEMFAEDPNTLGHIAMYIAKHIATFWNGFCPHRQNL